MDDHTDTIYLVERMNDRVHIHSLDYNFKRIGNQGCMTGINYADIALYPGCIRISFSESMFVYKSDGTLVGTDLLEAGFLDGLEWKLSGNTLTVNNIEYVLYNTYVYNTSDTIAFTTNDEYVWINKSDKRTMKREEGVKMRNVYTLVRQNDILIVNPFNDNPPYTVKSNSHTNCLFDIVIEESRGGLEVSRLSDPRQVLSFHPDAKFGSWIQYHEKGFVNTEFGGKKVYYSYDGSIMSPFEIDDEVIEFVKSPEFVYQDEYQINLYLVYPFLIEKLTILEQLELLAKLQRYFI